MSNFYPAPLHIDDIPFYTSEHAFMWLKAYHFNDADIMTQIASVKHPAEAKKLGRLVKGFNNAKWEKLRERAMHTAVLAKFRQNLGLWELLKATGSRTLVEASPTDKIWGVGLAEDDDLILDEKNWQGLNLLGKTLMAVRTFGTTIDAIS